MKYFFLPMVLFCTILLGCKKDTKANQVVIQETKSINLKCNLSQAEKIVFDLDEVKKIYNLIDSITNHKEGVSFISDSLELDRIQHYEIKVGYNSKLRFETYYTFYVERANCNNIKVLEPIEGDIITLNDWRNLEKQNKNEELLSNKSIKFSSSILPYQKKINVDNVIYQSMPVNSINGLSEFACGEDKIRYIPLDKIEKVNLILIPMDCGDSPYRYYLISIYNNSVISNLYVEGELYEPENNVTPEKTSFTIDKNSIVKVKTLNKNFENGMNEEKKYQISDVGNIVEVK